MEDMILLGQLQINSIFKYRTILSCHLQARYGEMTRLTVSCVVDYQEAFDALCRMQEEQVELSSQDEEGRQESLFSGLIDGAELKSVGNYTVLELKAVSYLWQMDIRKRSRSFQDIGRAYRAIVEEVAGEYGFKVNWNLPDRALSGPLIQYQETDWQFLVRIVSHLGGRLQPEDHGRKKEISAGLPQCPARPIDLAGYKHAEILYKIPGRNSVQERRTGYQIHGRTFIRVGEGVAVLDREYGVMACDVSFVHNSIETCISVYPRECFQSDKIPAEHLKGVVIEGEVLQTKGEVLRLHLEIDDSQDVSAAYDYPWRPITGNMLYCMPEKGTRAALYFDKDNEENAKAIYNLRENGEQCPELADPVDRYFTTDHEKRLYMRPAEMGFLNREGQNAEIAFADGSTVRMKTTNRLSIMAEGQVQFQAKRITVTAPKEATLVKKDMMKPTVINLCNAFDAIGSTGNFAAAPQVAAKKKKPAVSQTGGSAPLQEERYPLNGIVADILANIPSEDLEDPVMAAVAGSMPVVTRIRG